MTSITINFRDMSQNTHADFVSAVQEKIAQRTEIPEFFNARVSGIKDLIKGRSVHITANFDIEFGKKIETDELVKKLPKLAQALGFPYRLDCNDEQNPVQTGTQHPSVYVSNEGVIYGNTDIAVEAKTVSTITNVFFVNANSFEAIHALAVLEGVSKDTEYFSSITGMRKFSHDGGSGYGTYFEHQEGHRLVSKIRENHLDVCSIAQQDADVRVGVGTKAVLKKAGLSGPN